MSILPSSFGPSKHYSVIKNKYLTIAILWVMQTFFFRQGSHKTCPICRAAVQGQDDTWVLTEKPDTTEMAFETTGYLMGLAERTGSPAHSPST